MDSDEVILHHLGKFGVTRLPDIRLNDTLCPLDAVPSMAAYFSAINVYGITLFTLGGAELLLVMAMYADTLAHVMRNPPASVKTHTAVVISVYPVVAMATYCAMIVPRAQLLAEAVTQGMFMVAMYQLFCLLMAYCGGEAELIRRAKPDALDPRVGPCCCWPCCFCLPLCALRKNNVRLLRILVLQLPVIQGLVYLVLLVMWAEEESLYQVNYMYVQPVIILSILTGIWGMSMTMNILKEILKDHYIMGKFLVLQLVLLLAKSQGLLARIFTWTGFLPCKPPITPPVYGNLIYNCAMLIEMVILGFIARKIYKRPLPEDDSFPSERNNNTVEQISVISGNIGRVPVAIVVPPKVEEERYKF